FSAVGPHYPSMTIDILHGRRTEIDTFSIEIAQRGRALGVATPLNEALGTMVKLLEGSPEIATR
ncbi:MAG TPA: ketopantoate reductase C-terminal domain-containing protein, partial [Acidimicrobiia bacterium]|nr:ketopantoate reductase C-terminal domain-containing protein [Acidimicrobiia bacterium]